MATPADQRLLDLLDKWLNSLELHLKYASLDDESYLQIQPWPEHQRPSRWIIDLARQKAGALKSQVEERVALGDAKFSESLELMTFLANLVGAEHIERFIPLADAEAERAPHTAADQTQSTAAIAMTATREMPKFVMSTARDAAPVSTAQVARTERKGSDAKPAARAVSKPAVKPASSKPPAAPKIPAAKAPSPAKPERPASSERHVPPEAARVQVIADAARLMQWGRKWYELAELIASMAGRPPLTDVRRILKDNKTVIDQKAGRG